MKKLFFSLSLIAMLALKAGAVTVTTLLPINGFTNLVQFNNGSLRITSLIFSSTNATGTILLDANTNSPGYINPPYINIFSYATNITTIYTNYFGVTNYITNFGLVDITNSQAQASNAFPVLYQLTLPSNGVAVVSPVSIRAINGVWATNTGASSISITVTYTQ